MTKAQREAHARMLASLNVREHKKPEPGETRGSGEGEIKNPANYGRRSQSFSIKR